MSQHDMNIANQGFPAFRSDLNDALAALVSTSSGATAPSTTFANQLWYDTANDKLKIRNEANSGWIEIVSINQSTGVLTTIAGTVIDTPTITGAATFAAGTAGAPALTTAGDTNTGIFFPAADTIAFAEGGVEAVRINSDAQLVVSAGTASLPAVTKTGDLNTGVFFPAADAVAIATGGSERIRVNSSGELGIGGANYGTSGQVLTSNGSGAAPSWQSAAGGGVTSVSAGTGIAVSGTTAVTVSVVTTLGAVGTYAYLASASNASITAGTTYAGSGLRYSGFQNNSYSTNQSGCPPNFSTSGGPEAPSGGTPAGTWQAMGTVPAGSSNRTATLFIRTV